MRYYIADTHYYHRNLISKMDNRNFKTVEDMNEKMIEIHNKKVKKNDEVVFIGDFSFGTAEQTNEILERLNGTKYLIEGNHEKYLKDSLFNKNLFKWIKPYAELNDNNRKVILSHYPILFYNGQYRLDENKNPKTYHLCGHVHDTNDNKLLNKFILEQRNTKLIPASGIESYMPSNIINCFCMFSDYEPLTLDEWINITEKRLFEFKTKKS